MPLPGADEGMALFPQPQLLQAVFVQGLTKAYNGRMIVDYLNLSVKSGTVFGLLGANGADYTFLEQSFGAVGAVAICAGGLMWLPQAVTTMREYKILKRLRVTPVSPVFILGVELTMYIVYCSVSLAVLAVPAALFWHVRLRGSLLRFLGSRARCRRTSASSR